MSKNNFWDTLKMVVPSINEIMVKTTNKQEFHQSPPHPAFTDPDDVERHLLDFPSCTAISLNHLLY